MADTPDTYVDTPGRPSLDARDSNFNRIRLNPTTKEDILSHIDDSSESLPYYDDETTDNSTDHVNKLTAPEAIQPPFLLSKTKSGPKKRHSFFGKKDAGSALKQEVAPGDIATPKAEIRDPLAKKGATLTVPGEGGSDAGLTTPTGSGSLSQVPTQEDTSQGDVPKRPGTMRRLTTKIKRTISNRHDIEAGAGEEKTA